MKNFYALKDEHKSYTVSKLLTDEESIKYMIYNNDVDKYIPLQPFRKGSVVRLVDKRPSHWSVHGGMDNYLGKEMVVEHFTNRNVVFQDCETWIFYPSSIAEVIKY